MKSTINSIKGLLGLFICWIVLAVTGQALAQGGIWETKTPMLTARSSLHVAAIDGILHAVGGNDGSGDTPVHESYNSTTETWSTLAPLPQWDSANAGRYGGTMGVIDGKLYLVGGWRTSPPLPTGTLQIYDPVTDSWSLGATIPVPPSNLSACSAGGVIDRKLYVLTACNGYSGIFKYFHVYDPDLDNWTTLPEPPDLHGCDPAAGVIDGQLYVVGGHNGTNAVNIMDVYNPATNTWATKASMPTARYGLTAGVIEGKLYAVGGHDGTSVVNTVEVYDPSTDTWTTDTPMPTARSTASAVIDGKLYVVGGHDGTSVVDTLEVFSQAVTEIIIALDIKPQSCPNPLNVKSKGVLPVAILGTEDFDVTEIDLASIRLAGVAPIRSSIEDVSTPLLEKQDECDCITEGEDGIDDLTLKFDTQEIVSALGELADGDELVLTLTGELSDGTPIEGEDCIIILSKGKGKNK